MARTKIPEELMRKVLYDSAYACAFCQKPGIQVHHIDGNASHNVEDNLVCLCLNHHDEAHTKRTLSQNLTPEALKDVRARWTKQVHDNRVAAASVSGQLARMGPSSFMATGLAWGYINHKRVIQMTDAKTLDGDVARRLSDCKSLGLVDSDGIPIKPGTAQLADDYLRNTIYDWYDDPASGWRLHKLYEGLVDRLSAQIQPVHLESEWLTKERVLELAKPGSFVFMQSAFNFKPVSETEENEHRRVHTTMKSVKIEFYVDTRDMYGTTSMTVSFCGRQTCAALLQVKSIKDVDGKLVLGCTPIALGVSFQRLHSRLSEPPDA
jgi:hypothetical protein